MHQDLRGFLPHAERMRLVVENSAASQAPDEDGPLAQPQHDGAGQDGEPVRPGWTRSLAGTFLVTRSFAIVMPRGAPVRDSSQVVMPRASSRSGLITTSASSSDSTSWSSVVPSALAIGVS